MGGLLVSTQGIAVVPVDLKCHSCCVSSWPQGPQSLLSAGGGNGQVSSVNLSSDIQFTPNRQLSVAEVNVQS